ncbi:hypothetical protein E2562_024740 [Oryza meyeriana var. granulata]|uniref:Uncharacterized protein n=1 Tax=Oryza meyeriana var. granulata TaxID=110450 RepID=A0A6G1D7C4_9ORYZ|nr:hypothetical protein E2562_024740 [Oryza meyeriana var. granulata]
MLGGSVHNVPIGGSTRKRKRPAVRRPPIHFVGAPLQAHHPAPLPPPPSSQQAGLLGSLFALSAAPLLEGRVGFDLSLSLPGPGHIVTGGAACESSATALILCPTRMAMTIGGGSDAWDARRQ